MSEFEDVHDDDVISDDFSNDVTSDENSQSSNDEIALKEEKNRSIISAENKQDDNEPQTVTTLSKNQIRKLNRIGKKDEYRLRRRLRDREVRRMRNKSLKQNVSIEGQQDDLECNLTRKERVKAQKAEIVDKLMKAKNNSPKICIDLSWDNCMNEKERSQLSDHIQRIYGSNKRSMKPFHILLCNFEPESEIYKTCVRKHHGFLNYVIDLTEKPLLETFSHDQLVYLTPDSENELETLRNDKVYVLGGLVDLSVKKNETMSFAQTHKLNTASLPILKYMQMDRSRKKHSFKRILSINQVFDILLKFNESECWKTALQFGVPKRHGYSVSEVNESIKEMGDGANAKDGGNG